ncbi:MAG: biotin--[acetyl-CoA-carboxylase] ligase [Flavobacteriales bacterium]
MPTRDAPFMISGTREIGRELVELATVDSTNKHAADLLSLSKVQHGAVILAHEQTEGRGQRGRTWSSAAGKDLTFSIVLQPQVLKASGQFMLAKLAALAVHDVVAGQLKWGVGKRDEEVRIKWPNDVLVERRKIAGVLIRTEVQGERVTSAVVGIGLNVNSTELEAELGATSLRLETGREQDREALLSELCHRFEHHLATFRSGDQTWAASYTERLYARGRWADLELDGEPFRARPVDVDEQGRLLVEDEAGEVRAYGHDRLRFLRS